MAIERRLVEAVEVTESQIHIIRLKGIFDASTVSEFEKVVSYLLARQFFKMVVDLGGVEFISSAGWGAFTAELRRVRENDGDMKLAGMSTDVFDVFLLLELDRFISSYDTEDEAIRAFRPPEPAAEPVLEQVIPPSYRKAPQAIPAKETIETNAPAVFPARPPAPSYDDEAEYQRPYTIEGETVEVEAEVSTFDQPGENGFDQEEDDINDDTLEIETNLSLAAKGPEMYELLLTSGRPAFEPVVPQRSLPPPSLHTRFNDIYASGDSDATSDQHDQDHLGAEAELQSHKREPAADDGKYAETQEFAGLLSGSDLDFSGHEPIVDETDETAGVSDPMAAAAVNSSAPAAQNFFRHDTEAFSELSLDLESHLQVKERQAATRNAFGDLGDFGSELEKEFSNTNGAETVFSEPAPAHNNNGNATENFTEDFAAPPFSTPAAGFSPPAYSSFDAADEHDDDFETHDIHDPWILEEIDTFPEEYEMEGRRAEDDERPIAAALISGDFDFNWQASVFSPENKAAPAEIPAATKQKRHAQAVSSATALFDETEVAVNFESDWQPSAAAREDEAELEERPSVTPRKRKPKTEITSPAAALFDDAEAEPNLTPSFPEKPKTNGKRKSGSEPILTELPKIPMSGDVAEMICGIVAAYPDYGANMICKFLEERVEPPVLLSRAKVYRYLCEANLNTRQKRFEYAG